VTYPTKIARAVTDVGAIATVHVIARRTVMVMVQQPRASVGIPRAAGMSDESKIGVGKNRTAYGGRR
jgi:hypothetical protein